MKYSTMKKIKDDLEDLVKQIRVMGNEKSIHLANEMSKYIPAYDFFLKDMDKNESIHDFTMRLSIRETQILIAKIKFKLFTNDLSNLDYHVSRIMNVLFKK